MARNAKITFEMVASAAEAIVNSGDSPTCRNVRRELGDIGSNEKIAEYLRRWKEDQKTHSPATDDALNPAIVRAINEDIASKANTLSEAARSEIAELKDNESTLIATCLAYQQENDDLQKKLDECEVSSSELRGKYHSKEDEYYTLTETMSDLRSSYEALRMKFAVAELQVAELAECKSKIRELDQALVKEREKSAQAEKVAAVATATLAEKKIQTDELARQFAVVAKERDAALAQFAESNSREAALQDKVTEIRRQLDKATDALNAAIRSEKKAIEVAAEQRGQINEFRNIEQYREWLTMRSNVVATESKPL
jgi:chromosome segregation ATPase